MNKTFIQNTISYLKEVEDMLCAGTTNVKMNIHLTKLYKLIETLMQDTFKSQDQAEKVILATLGACPIGSWRLKK